MTVDDLLRDAAHDLDAEVRASVDAPSALDRVVAARPARRLPWLPAAAALVVILGLAAVVVMAADDRGEPVTSGAPTTEPATAMAGPAPGESEGVPMTATPSTDLADGDEVEVVAEGLAPAGDEHVAFAMCTADALATGTGMEACQGLEWEAPTPNPAEPGGPARGTVVVERVLSLGDGSRTVDCALDVRCAIGVVVEVPLSADEGGTGSYREELRGLVGVGLTEQPALVMPSVQVTPTEGLRHGDTVTVVGEDFGRSVGTGEICTTGPDPLCAFTTLGDERDHEIATDESGGFETEVTVWRAFFRDGRLVDCATVACTFAVVGDDGRPSPLIPLTFDPAVPVPQVPTLTITPTTGIRPGDPITITATGLLPGRAVDVDACITDGSTDVRCIVSETIGTLVADADGRVQGTVPAIDPAAIRADCRGAEACSVTLRDAVSFGGDPMFEQLWPVWVQYAP